MTRAELERKFWLGLQQLGLDRRGRVPAVNIIDNWLDDAEAYARRQETDHAQALLQAMKSDTPELQAARREALTASDRTRG